MLELNNVYKQLKEVVGNYKNYWNKTQLQFRNVTLDICIYDHFSLFAKLKLHPRVVQHPVYIGGS